jgi:hypothetical protein
MMMIEQILMLCLTAVISGLTGLLGTYAAFKFLKNRGFFMDILYDFMAEIGENKDLQQQITGLGALFGTGLMNALGKGGTKRRGGMFDDIIGAVVQKFIGGQQQGEEQPKSPFGA